MFENEQTFKSDGEPDRRGRKRAETRQKLLNAAMQLYAAGGFDSATVRDIAERADLGLGTLYAHFKDKAELSEALLDEAVSRLNERLRDAAKKQRGAAGMLDAACRGFFEFALKNRPLFRILFERAGGESPKRRAARRELFLDGVRRILRAGTAEGVFGDWNEEFAAAAVVATMANAVHLVLEAPRDEIPELIDQAIAFALAALKTQPAGDLTLGRHDCP